VPVDGPNGNLYNVNANVGCHRISEQINSESVVSFTGGNGMGRTVLAWVRKAEQSELAASLPEAEFRLVFCQSLAELGALSSEADVGVVACRSGEAADLGRALQEVRATGQTVPLVLIVPHHAPDMAANAHQLGWSGYVRRPLVSADLAGAIRGCLESSPAVVEAEADRRLIGHSPAIRELKSQIRAIAATDCNVLITGETGAGKELVAELVHRNSARREYPLVSVNCAAIPDSLWESELFGYEKGAFTGADCRKPGTLEAGNGGTVFLDEIGEMSRPAQAKMLRVIEGRRVVRLGGTGPVGLNIRMVAATNCNVEDMVESGHFRPDLYFRLSVARIHIPPLRERREDVPELVHHYLQEFNARFGREVQGLSEETNRLVCNHDWPGNVRELRNIIEASFVHLPFARMRYLELPEEYRSRLAAAEKRHLDDAERLQSTLAANNWNISKTATALHWSRVTLYRKMAKYSLRKPPKPHH
jgi:DNA-binding NtrC family response regulator